MSEMFEQELEMEKRASWGPLLLVIALVVAVVGGGGYYWIQLKKGLTQDEATVVINDLLKTRGTSVKFFSGKVDATMDEPKDPHYKLLEKAGYLKLKNISWNTTGVTVTPEGEKLLAEIPGVKKEQKPDNIVSYVVPIAQRKLVKINSIEMNGPMSARVEYEWAWQTTKLGDTFEVSGAMVKGFGTWDRQKLIDKYGADFYKSDPKKSALLLVKKDNQWELATN